MAVEFRSLIDPSEEMCREMASLNPANPFYTWAYAEAMRMQGYQVWLLSVFDDTKLVFSCPCLIQSGIMSRALQICSLPDISKGECHLVFWRGLTTFCCRNRVSDLFINSYASTVVDIPPLSRDVTRKHRWEYVLDLRDADLWKQLSRNHRRNITRGKELGLRLLSTSGESACREHIRVCGASMLRRRKRGETTDGHDKVETYMTFLNSGAGELFQVIHNKKVLSSMLMLKSEVSVYGHTSGSSEDGMQCGAAHFMWYEIMRLSQERGLKVFNMGGTDQPDSGLGRFKAGFRPRIVELESAEFFFGSRLKKQLRAAVRLLRRIPRQ